jgi:predicted acylesterase/phospholipase RssA/ABC-type phosphate/phosphonate transport system substrate-binding protein
MFGPAATASEPPPVRVGVVAYEDFAAELGRWREVFAEVAGRHDPPLEVEIAAGTYGDLLHWMERGLVDVAVLTPGVFAEILQTPADFRYVASIRLAPAVSKWASADRRVPDGGDSYRSVCVVRSDSPLETADDLRDAAAGGRLQFVFVHPLSVSGRIAPQFALQQAGIKPSPGTIEFSHSHTGSLRLVAEPDEGRERVAFVWDDALEAAPELADGLRAIELPELDGLEIPHDVIAARGNFEHFDWLGSALEEYAGGDGRPRFHVADDWSRRYEGISDWSREIGLTRYSDDAQMVTLGEIGQILLQHARSQAEPPRLAVVFSGGGAKCSYQVGAVAALEEELAEIRRRNPDCPADIALVVGTSGGAINSVPVALGVTSTEAGRADFQEVWRQLDQREIVRPAGVVRANIGLWFALVQIGAVLWLVAHFAKTPRRRGWIVCGSLVALAVVQIIAGYVRASPWTRLGENHVWHHAWLWCTFGIRASAWFLLVLGLAGLVAQALLVRRGKCLALPRRPVAWTLVVLLLALPLGQLVMLLFWQETLSGGEGMEHALAREFPDMVSRHLERRGQRPLDVDPRESDARRLAEASRQIVGRRLLRRDLVITGNCLEQSRETLPSDLYFYASADGSEPPFGARGIALSRRPSLLLDVVLGSSSIFPVFPPRRLEDFPDTRESVELVDGGFAHNSPIEAAVLWGATHVVLIEATPERRRRRSNFVENAATAFTHLHKQTQLVDKRSKQQVDVFTLAPEPPHLCVLDFADNLIAASIRRGYRDAGGRSAPSASLSTQVPRFRKELGEPVFTRVALPD